MMLAVVMIPIGLAALAVFAYTRLATPMIASTRDAERARRRERARRARSRTGPPIVSIRDLAAMKREVAPYVRDATARRPTGLRVPLLVLRSHRGRHSLLSSRLTSVWRWVGPVITFAGESEFAASEPWALPAQGQQGVTRNDAQLRERLTFAGCAKRSAPFGGASILCHDGYWERALGEILAAVRLAVIDLRGTEAKNPHAARELGFLLERGRLQQIVIVTDSIETLEELTADLWRHTPRTSPRFEDVLQVLEVTGEDVKVDPALLVALLYTSAAAPGGPLLR